MIINFKIFEDLHRMKTLMVENKLPQIFQPTGNSCGPTCIKMVGEFLIGKLPEIDEICELCGTDWVVGTPPEKMEKGLEELNISYKIHLNEMEPFQSIKNTIDKDNIAIVRTITKEIPHWIVIKDYDEDNFYVNDPWLGEIVYTEEQLNSIWKTRDYFYFEILSKNIKPKLDIFIRKMEFEDLPMIYPNFEEVYKRTGLSNDDVWDEIYEFDLEKSLVAEVNGQIAGFYFMIEKPIPEELNPNLYEKFRGLKGLEGMALGVYNKFKNLGIGKKLIETSQSMGYDYVWGYQLKTLKNIDDWLKRRKIYAETPTLYVTYQMLK